MRSLLPLLCAGFFGPLSNAFRLEKERLLNGTTGELAVKDKNPSLYDRVVFLLDWTVIEEASPKVLQPFIRTINKIGKVRIVTPLSEKRLTKWKADNKEKVSVLSVDDGPSWFSPHDNVWASPMSKIKFGCGTEEGCRGNPEEAWTYGCEDDPDSAPTTCVRHYIENPAYRFSLVSFGRLPQQHGAVQDFCLKDNRRCSLVSTNTPPLGDRNTDMALEAVTKELLEGWRFGLLTTTDVTYEAWERRRDNVQIKRAQESNQAPSNAVLRNTDMGSLETFTFSPDRWGKMHIAKPRHFFNWNTVVIIDFDSVIMPLLWDSKDEKGLSKMSTVALQALDSLMLTTLQQENVDVRILMPNIHSYSKLLEFPYLMRMFETRGGTSGKAPLNSLAASLPKLVQGGKDGLIGR